MAGCLVAMMTTMHVFHASRVGAVLCTMAAGVVLTLTPVVASGGIAKAGFTCRRGASFERLPRGWAHQTAGCAQHTGGSFSVWSIATSWRYRADPHGPVAQMRRDRVLISVILNRPNGFPASSAHARLRGKHRLQLNAADQVASEKDAPTIPQYRFFRRVGCQYDLDLRVDFGRPHPTRAMKRQAQRALDALVLPRWPPRC